MGTVGAVAGSALLPSGLWAADSYEELRKELTPLKAITNYNNFYEFSTKKEDVAPLSQGFRSSPWGVKVGGQVSRPATFDIDDIRKRFPQEERVYRLRCVEGWSMVIPWTGFPLAALLKAATDATKYVRFETLQDW
jgi:sulfoxide reductase catalytic subunit YedY